MTTANTRLQLAVPGHMRGRVMGIYALLFVGTTPIGAYVMGGGGRKPPGRRRHGADHGRAVRGGRGVGRGLIRDAPVLVDFVKTGEDSDDGLEWRMRNQRLGGRPGGHMVAIAFLAAGRPAAVIVRSLLPFIAGGDSQGSGEPPDSPPAASSSTTLPPSPQPPDHPGAGHRTVHDDPAVIGSDSEPGIRIFPSAGNGGYDVQSYEIIPGHRPGERPDRGDRRGDRDRAAGPLRLLSRSAGPGCVGGPVDGDAALYGRGAARS